MIKPNVRASFGRREAELLLAVVGPGGEERLRERVRSAIAELDQIIRKVEV